MYSPSKTYKGFILLLTVILVTVFYYLFIHIRNYDGVSQMEFVLPNMSDHSSIPHQTLDNTSTVNTSKSVKSKEYQYYRVDTTPEKTSQLPFMEHFKNPCWRELFPNRSMTQIRCLPYFYVVGVPKCGTTDLYRRLVQHPLISAKAPKEPHWLTRARFHSVSGMKLSAYLGIFQPAVTADITRIQQDGYFNSIMGDCSASTLWDNSKLLRFESSSNFTLPPRTNANVIFNLYNKTKILMILRDPIQRLYSDYLYFARQTSPKEFHNIVTTAVKKHQDCLKRQSLRYCAYFDTDWRRFQIGLYHIYIEDFMRVFPKEQIKILKLEDYSRNISGTMADVYRFLDIGVPSREEMQAISSIQRVNANDQKLREIGGMELKTFNLLKKFYKPYNEQLVKLLGNKFNYNSNTTDE